MTDEEKKAQRAAWNREWIKNNREQYNKTKSQYRFKLKIDAIRHYSNGDMCCAWCGFNADVDALTLDHINDDGAEHRKSLGVAGRGTGAGTTMYERLRALGWLEGLQVLCANCNTIKAIRLRRGSTSDEMLALPKMRWKQDD